MFLDEQVLCIDLGDLSSERLIPPAHLNAYVRDAVRRDRLFLPRDAVEDPRKTRLRHLVPYLVLVSPDLKKFLVRWASDDPDGAEAWNVGFGGHLTKEDFLQSDGTVEGAARVCVARELREELRLDLSRDVTAFRVLGWLASSATKDSRVHLGMVWVLFLAEEAEGRRAPGPAVARWMFPEGLVRLARLSGRDDWSGILCRSLFQARSLREALIAQPPEEPVARAL